MAKRGYKLQEFVAHPGNVNCLCIGKKVCRLFLTGGENCKVNLWAIGKPNSLMSLCDHTSPVESVAFDAAETLVLAGASCGVIKLWDIEEVKMVRGLTGHRSGCSALEFHPFGEFFASGSMDTNLKLWDIRKKGCIHTYKGHTRGISTIRFSPDGRWVVSGGLDNVVKVWDLTAGKLLHDFKFHENHIQSISFHPLEFLLATGSADRTVKFWDLETFELIGSTRPEGSGVRAITFHPDGRTLFCGLDDSLKVYSWELVICHDTIDMGWSTLGDICIHEGKILGCSYYQNSVGVWVADISLIEPYGGANLAPLQKDSSGHTEFDLKGSWSSAKVGSGVRSTAVVRCPSPDYEPKEIKNIYIDTGETTVSPQLLASVNPLKVILPVDPQDFDSSSIKRHALVTASPEKSVQPDFLKSYSMPDIMGQDGPERKESSLPRRESITFSRTKPGMLLKPAHRRRPSSTRIDSEVLYTETKPNADTKFSFDAHANVVLPKPAHARRLSSTKFDAEVVLVPVENTTIEDTKVSSPKPAADIRRPSSTKFDHEVLSTSTESKLVDSTKSVWDSPADMKSNTRLAPKDTPKESTGDDAPSSNKNALEKLGKMSPQTPKPVKCESQSSGEGISSIKIVNGVAVVPGRTRTLVEKFERREKLNGTEDQTSLEPCQETAIADKQNTFAVEKIEKICHSADSKIAILPPPTTPTRDEAPSVPVSVLGRREISKGKTRDTENTVTPNLLHARDKISRHSIESFERRNMFDSTEEENTIMVALHAVPRDKTCTILNGGFERREDLDSNEDEKTVMLPCAVLNETPTALTSNFEREPFGCKEEEKSSTPPRALPRDRTLTTLCVSSERRGRFNSKEEQATRLSNRVIPPREKTHITVIGGIRRDKLNNTEDQMVNASTRLILSRDRSRTSTMTERLERSQRFNTNEDQESSIPLRTISAMDRMATARSEPHVSGREADFANDEDVAEILMQSHEVFLSTLRSRLTKLQVICHFFNRNDMKGAINAMRKLPDHSVQADVISILMEKMENLNVDLFSCLLPVLVGLLDSKIERHTSLSLEMLLKLVAVFGHVVFSTVSGPPAVGVDLHAEQRRECCSQCFSQLQKIKKILPLLVSRGGVIARCVQELNLVLLQQL